MFRRIARAGTTFLNFRPQTRSIISVHRKTTTDLVPTVNLVTTWNTHCGIASYSAFLEAELKERVAVRIITIPDRFALSPYFFILGVKTGKSKDLVHVQFEYSKFSDLMLGNTIVGGFSALPFYLGLAFGSKPVITTYHEIPKSICGFGRFKRLLDKLVCQVSDLIIVHNLESKELMKKLYGLDDSKLKVIPHGCYQTPLFLNKEECKKKLGLSGKTIIIIPGFIRKSKGHDLVLSLIPRLEKNTHLLFAGEPWTSVDEIYCKKLKAFAKQNDCSDRVTFTGYISDLSTVLNAADVAILPYRSVTDSGILHLLVAFGVPTITSDLEAFKEIQQEYSCIELFQNGDKEDLLAKINSLLSNCKKRQLLKENCQKMWNDTKWSTIAEKHVRTYIEVLGEHHPSKSSSMLGKQV